MPIWVLMPEMIFIKYFQPFFRNPVLGLCKTPFHGLQSMTWEHNASIKNTQKAVDDFQNKPHKCINECFLICKSIYTF